MGGLFGSPPLWYVARDAAAALSWEGSGKAPPSLHRPWGGHLLSLVYLSWEVHVNAVHINRLRFLSGKRREKCPK